MLVNMTQMLAKARKERYAVGAFNILDYISMKAAVNASSELHSPLIIQTSEKTVKFWGYSTIVNWMKELAGAAHIPIALHLDHCKDLEVIRNCINEGWTSVMIDASSKPFEENIELSARVVEMAHPHGVSVEAELGEIGGVEEDIVVAEEDAHLASPEKAMVFLEKVKVDCFAPAIGTAHGVYKGEPKIAFEKLEEIGSRTNVPLALHGGTGLSEDIFKRCIELGCAKINISTQLKYAFIDGFIKYYNTKPNEYNPLPIMQSQYDMLVHSVKENISLFGSSGKIR